MAKEAVANDPKLQVKILEFLVNNNDTMEALHFAQNFNVPQNMWPWHLENYFNDNPNCNILFNNILVIFSTIVNIFLMTNMFCFF